MFSGKKIALPNNVSKHLPPLGELHATKLCPERLVSKSLTAEACMRPYAVGRTSHGPGSDPSYQVIGFAPYLCERNTADRGKSYHSLPKDSLWQNVKVQNVFEGTFLDLNCLSGMMQNGNLYVSTS